MRGSVVGIYSSAKGGEVLRALPLVFPEAGLRARIHVGAEVSTGQAVIASAT
jgi:hypothetical protein